MKIRKVREGTDKKWLVTDNGKGDNDEEIPIMV